MIPDSNIQKQIDDYWTHHRHCVHPDKYAAVELMDFLNGQLQEHSFAARGIYEPVKCKECGRIIRIDNARDGKEYFRALAKSFLKHNHLQGSDNSTICHGLFYNGKLVEVMTFGKPRFNGNYDYELIRNASAIGCNVNGGLSRLLAFFIKKHHDSTIVSYDDRRYSHGNVYAKNGFSFVKNTSPNYWRCKKKHKYSRYQCQKGILACILGDKFDQSLIENENMLLAGSDKIYDCGNSVYVYGDKK